MGKKKVLLMGKSGAGKTSMRSIIFANYIARDTRRLGATIDVEQNHVRFLGNLVLNLWDCGGQDSFMDNYISSQREQIFRNVELLIYVFDVESREWEKDLQYFQKMMQGILEYSKDAAIFCLIHKMDLIQQDQREKIMYKWKTELSIRCRPIQPVLFETSIWDETLYRAWSSIVYTLIPNVKILEKNLQKFCVLAEAAEVILFEKVSQNLTKTTFLVISHVKSENFVGDSKRFEKMSNIIKQFKLSCAKSQSQLQTMEIRSQSASIFIRPLTVNTFIMVVLTNTKIQSSLAIMNIEAVKDKFTEIEKAA